MSQARWYFKCENEERGPFTARLLQRMVDNGVIQTDTLVRKGEQVWVEAGQTDFLKWPTQDENEETSCGNSNAPSLPESIINSNSNSREQIEEIAALVANQEDAIRERDARLWDVFVKYRDTYINSKGELDEQTELLILVKRYLMSSSLIAAYFYLKHDKTNRDKAAQSCVVILSLLGCNPTEMFYEHISCEKLWIMCLRREGLAPTRYRVVGAILVFAIAIGIVYWWFR